MRGCERFLPFAVFRLHFAPVVGGGMKVKYLFLLSQDPPTCSAAASSAKVLNSLPLSEGAKFIQIIIPEQRPPSSGSKHIRTNYPMVFANLQQCVWM